MTKQIVTSPESSGACGSTTSELGVESFERLLKGFQSQLAGFKPEDTVLIGNCPQNVTDEEINKFFCGFATIVKLQRVAYKSLTTQVCIARFDSTESASRSKVLNNLALNGKKILLLQPDGKQIFNRKNVVELNGLQEHSEEVIYDHMSTFGNVSFVLKTSTVTYIVFEELSAVASSCRCDYLDQYPVTIRSVLDSAGAAGGGGPGTSIETCILEQIDQNSSLLADEEEGQINNFMQLLDMENLDEYLEQDEKDKSSASDKPLLEVGNEEIIATEDEAAEGEKEADVAAIEKEALQQTQSQRKKTAGTVLVDDRAQRILKLSSSLLHLTDLPQLNVAVSRVRNKVKIRPKKGALPSKHGESKQKKKKEKSAMTDSSASKKDSEASGEPMKKQKEFDSKAKHREPSVEKKKSKKEDGEEEEGEECEKKKKEKSAMTDSSASKKDSEASGEHMKKQKESVSKAKHREPSVEKKKSKKETSGGKEESKSVEKLDKENSPKKHTKKQVSVNEQTENKSGESIVDKSEGESKTKSSDTVSSDEKKESEHGVKAKIEEHKHKKDKKQTEHKKEKKSEKTEVKDSKPGVSESTNENTEADQGEKKAATQRKVEAVLQSKKSAFVQLTKLTSKQIEELSQIRRKPATSHGEVDGDVPDKLKEHDEKKVVKKRRPGPAKGAMKEKQPVTEETKVAEKHGLSDSETDPSKSSAKKPVDADHTQKKSKKPKLDKSPEKDKSVQLEAEEPKTEAGTGEGKSTTPEESKVEVVSDQKKETQEPKVDEPKEPKVDEPKVDSQQTTDEPAVPSEATSEAAPSEVQERKVIEAIPDVSSTVEVNQVEPTAEVESDEERPLVMDITLDTTDELLGKPSAEDRKVVQLDSRSAALLKGKTHDDHLLFLDVLPRVAIKIKHITASDYIITRPKEHAKPSSEHPKPSSEHPKPSSEHSKPASEHHEKHPPKKVSFDSSAEKKRKEDKPEKPRKTNLDRIDSKFLPANSKLKSKVKSKTDINHKKHLPVPELPIELKTHLNTSFKIPKKDSSVTPQSIARNASELNCLHKEQDDQEKKRKRFQKERRPRPDGQGGPGGREWKQHKPRAPEARQEQREPSPFPDFFDPSLDDDNHSPSPQRIPPTPPPTAAPPTNATPHSAQKDGNQRPHAAQNRGNNKPTFQDIWNIPEKKPEVWAKPPWGGSAPAPAPGPNTIGSGDTWDSEPVQPTQRKPLRENQAPVARAPPPRNTIDSGESWSPGGAASQKKPDQQQSSRKIDDGESWSPGANRREQQPQRDARQDRHPPPQFSARRSRSPHQVQLSNTIGGGDMWDLDPPPTSAPRRAPSPKRTVQQNPLLGGGPTWDDEPTGVASPPQRDRRSPVEQQRPSVPPNRDQRRRSRSPLRQRRSRSRSPGRRQRSRDRSQNQSPDRRNAERSRNRAQSPADRQHRPPDRRDHIRGQSPFGRQQRRSRSRSPARLQVNFERPSRSERSCSPRPGLTLSPGDMWDAGPPPRTQMSRNPLLAGGAWDDEIVPLSNRSPPRLGESLLDDHRQYGPNRFSPRTRSSSRDRLLPERRNPNYERSPLREGDNRRWSRDRSPNRRKRSRSRSPPGRDRPWRRSMERSPVGRRRSPSPFRDRSPGYQEMMDYWKAVEDREEELDRASERLNLERRNEFGPERWESRRSGRDSMDRNAGGRIDSETPWANQPKPRHRAMDDSQYSPSGAFDAISSDEECDFTNRKRSSNEKSLLPERDPYETIPFERPPRSEPAATSRTADREGSCDSLGSVPSFKEDDVSEAEHPQVQASEKRNVLENLKQRAERLKKLEEMKLARQKLLAQIKQKHPARSSPPPEVDKSMHVQPSEKIDKDKQTPPEPVQGGSSIPVLVAATVIPTAKDSVSTVDSTVGKPLVPAVPPPLPQMPPLPIYPLLPYGIAPPIPPLPSEAPPPPPPEEPRPPEPVIVPPPSNAWNPPPHPPIPHIDVSKPPPNFANPLLNKMPSPEYDSPKEEFFDDRPNPFNPRFPPSNSMDESRGINTRMRDFNEPNLQRQQHGPPELENRQPQNRFGDNRQFMRPQQQQQQHQQHDPRQGHDGNFQRGGRFNSNRGKNFNNNNNPRNNFNRNDPGNNFGFEDAENTFNPDNSENNVENNPGNNFRNNNSNNNFRNNSPDNTFNNNDDSGNNFDFEDQGNNFDFDGPPNNFNNNNDPRNNFNNNRGNFFNNNNNPRGNFNNNNARGNFNNNNPRGNFNNNNPRGNFNNNNPRGNFNNNNPRGNFNNNNPRNNFNMNDPRNRFNNNNRRNNFNNNPDNNFNNNPDNNFNNNPGNNFNNNNNPGNNFDFDDSGNNFDFDGPGNNFNNNDPRNNFNNNFGNNNNNPDNFFRNNRGGRGGRGGGRGGAFGRGRFNNNQQMQQQQRFPNFQQQQFNNNNNRNNQQQRRFLMQEQEMFDESCFDENEILPDGGGGGGDNGDNWEDDAME